MHTLTSRGFTSVHVVYLILIVGSVSAAAVPSIVHFADHQQLQSERDVVAAIRCGLDGDAYHATLDQAAPGRAQRSNRLFTHVIDRGVTHSWTKIDDRTYRGPAGGLYEHVAQRRAFLLKTFSRP